MEPARLLSLSLSIFRTDEVFSLDAAIAGCQLAGRVIIENKQSVATVFELHVNGRRLLGVRQPGGVCPQ